jgi:hypothetical protein
MVFALVVLTLGACRQLDPVDPSGTPEPRTLGAPSGSTIPATPKGESADASAGEDSATRSLAPMPLVDLLRVVPSTVAVSSSVDNPRDFPEHLVDGKLETAWNGRTGDLHGWMGFSVPADAHVDHVEIVPGYAHTSKTGVDLFLANHRIAKVRVSRASATAPSTSEGFVVLREASLDTSKRELQSIPIDAEGGRFRIEVLETVPGTRASWRELTVSELRVMGRPGATVRKSPTYPLVSVGSLTLPDKTTPYTVTLQETDVSPTPPKAWLDAVDALGAPARSETSFLNDWNAKASPAFKELFYWKEVFPQGLPKAVDAGPASSAFVPNAEVAALRKVVVHGSSTRFTLLGIEGTRGFEVSLIPLWHEYYSDPGCFGGSKTRVVGARVEAPANPRSSLARVVVEIENVWTNSRTFETSEGKLERIVYPRDVSHERLECELPVGPERMACTRTMTSRVCGTSAEPVPCDSY